VRQTGALTAMAIRLTLTEADRRAAVSVTTSRVGHKFEIQLGNLCNNRCNFCSSGKMSADKIAKPVPMEPVFEALEEARAAGARHLTFLGGEPTIHKRFVEAVAKARELGFEHIVIFTNGVMFPHPGFIDSITALGQFEWRVSIQGANEDAHVATTGRPDSFRRILHGLAELQRRGQTVTANMCVNTLSYRSLPEYPDLLAKYGVRQLHVDIVRPDSIGDRDEVYLREIMPRYSDMAPYYAAMLEGFERTNPDFDVNIGNLPYCILPAWGSHIHHGGETTVTRATDGDGSQKTFDKYDWHESLRTHLPGCADCVFRSSCTGIFRAYLAVHGGDEFTPVSREALAALDPERRNLVRLIEPELASLKAAMADDSFPASWHLTAEISEHRRQAVEWTFAHRISGRMKIRWVRPTNAGHLMLTTADYGLDAEADLGVPAAAVRELLSWIHATLAETDPMLPPLAADAVDRARHGALLVRGRARVAQMIRRLAAFDAPGWSLGAPRWSASDRAEIEVRSVSRASVSLAFSVTAANGRSQVGLVFEPSADCDEDSARTIAARVTALLQPV